MDKQRNKISNTTIKAQQIIDADQIQITNYINDHNSNTTLYGQQLQNFIKLRDFSDQSDEYFINHDFLYQYLTQIFPLFQYICFNNVQNQMTQNGYFLVNSGTNESILPLLSLKSDSFNQGKYLQIANLTSQNNTDGFQTFSYTQTQFDSRYVLQSNLNSSISSYLSANGFQNETTNALEYLKLTPQSALQGNLSMNSSINNGTFGTTNYMIPRINDIYNWVISQSYISTLPSSVLQNNQNNVMNNSDYIYYGSNSSGNQLQSLSQIQAISTLSNYYTQSQINSQANNYIQLNGSLQTFTNSSGLIQYNSSRVISGSNILVDNNYVTSNFYSISNPSNYITSSNVVFLNPSSDQIFTTNYLLQYKSTRNTPSGNDLIDVSYANLQYLQINSPQTIQGNLTMGSSYNVALNSGTSVGTWNSSNFNLSTVASIVNQGYLTSASLTSYLQNSSNSQNTLNSGIYLTYNSATSNPITSSSNILSKGSDIYNYIQEYCVLRNATPYNYDVLNSTIYHFNVNLSLLGSTQFTEYLNIVTTGGNYSQSAYNEYNVVNSSQGVNQNFFYYQWTQIIGVANSYSFVVLVPFSYPCSSIFKENINYEHINKDHISAEEFFKKLKYTQFKNKLSGKMEFNFIIDDILADKEMKNISDQYNLIEKNDHPMGGYTYNHHFYHYLFSAIQESLKTANDKIEKLENIVNAQNKNIQELIQLLKKTSSIQTEVPNNSKNVQEQQETFLLPFSIEQLLPTADLQIPQFQKKNTKKKNDKIL